MASGVRASPSKPSVPINKQLRIMIPKAPDSCPGGISVSISSLPSDGISPGRKTVSFEFSDDYTDIAIEKIAQKMKKAAESHNEDGNEMAVPCFKLQDPPKSRIKRGKSISDHDRLPSLNPSTPPSSSSSSLSSPSSSTLSSFKTQRVQGQTDRENTKPFHRTNSNPIPGHAYSPVTSHQVQGQTDRENTKPFHRTNSNPIPGHAYSPVTSHQVQGQTDRENTKPFHRTNSNSFSGHMYSPVTSHRTGDIKSSPISFQPKGSPTFRSQKVKVNQDSTHSFTADTKRTLSDLDTQILHQQPLAAPSPTRRRRQEARSSPYSKKTTTSRESLQSPNSRSSDNPQLADPRPFQKLTPPIGIVSRELLFQGQLNDCALSTPKKNQELRKQPQFPRCLQKSADEVMKQLQNNNDYGVSRPCKMGQYQEYSPGKLVHTSTKDSRISEICIPDGNSFPGQENHKDKSTSHETPTQPSHEYYNIGPAQPSNQINVHKSGAGKTHNRTPVTKSKKNDGYALPEFGAAEAGRGQDEVDGDDVDDDVMDYDDDDDDDFSNTPSTHTSLSSHMQFSNGRHNPFNRCLERFLYPNPPQNTFPNTPHSHQYKNTSSSYFTRHEPLRQPSPLPHQPYRTGSLTGQGVMRYQVTGDTAGLDYHTSPRLNVGTIRPRLNDTSNPFASSGTNHSRIQDNPSVRHQFEIPRQMFAFNDRTDSGSIRSQSSVGSSNGNRFDRNPSNAGGGSRDNITIEPEEILDLGEDEIVLERDEDEEEDRAGGYGQGHFGQIQGHSSSLGGNFHRLHSYTDRNNNVDFATKVMTTASTNAIFIDPDDLLGSSMSCDDSMDGSDPDDDVIDVGGGGDCVPKEGLHTGRSFYIRDRFDETDGGGTQQHRIGVMGEAKAKSMPVLDHAGVKSDHVVKSGQRSRTNVKAACTIPETFDKSFHRKREPQMILAGPVRSCNTSYTGHNCLGDLHGNSGRYNKRNEDKMGRMSSFGAGGVVDKRVVGNDINDDESDDGFDEVDGLGDDNVKDKEMDISQHSVGEKRNADADVHGVVHCVSDDEVCDPVESNQSTREESMVVPLKDCPGTSGYRDEVDGVSSKSLSNPLHQTTTAQNQSSRTYSVLQQHGSEQFEMFVASSSSSLSAAAASHPQNPEVTATTLAHKNSPQRSGIIFQSPNRNHSHEPKNKSDHICNVPSCPQRQLVDSTKLVSLYKTNAGHSIKNVLSPNTRDNNSSPVATSKVPYNIAANSSPVATSKVPYNIAANSSPVATSKVPYNIAANSSPVATSKVPYTTAANIQPNTMQRWKTNVCLDSPESAENPRTNELSVIKIGKGNQEVKISRDVLSVPLDFAKKSSEVKNSSRLDSKASSPKPPIYRPWLDSPGNPDRTPTKMSTLEMTKVVTTSPHTSPLITLPPITSQEIISQAIRHSPSLSITRPQGHISEDSSTPITSQEIISQAARHSPSLSITRPQGHISEDSSTPITPQEIMSQGTSQLAMSFPVTRPHGHIVFDGSPAPITTRGITSQAASQSTSISMTKPHGNIIFDGSSAPIASREKFQSSQSTSFSIARPQGHTFFDGSPARDKRRSDGDTSLRLSHPSYPSPPSSPRQINLPQLNTTNPSNSPRIIVSGPQPSSQEIRSLLRKEQPSTSIGQSAGSSQTQFDQSEARTDFIQRAFSQSVLPSPFYGKTSSSPRSAVQGGSGIGMFKSTKRHAATRLDFGSSGVFTSPRHSIRPNDSTDSSQIEEDGQINDTTPIASTKPSTTPKTTPTPIRQRDDTPKTRPKDSTKIKSNEDKKKRGKRKAENEVDIHLEVTDLHADRHDPLAQRHDLQSRLRGMQEEVAQRQCECATAEREILMSAIALFGTSSEIEAATTDTPTEIHKNNDVITDTLDLASSIRGLCRHGRRVSDVFPGSVVLRVKCPTLAALYDLCDLHKTGYLQRLMCVMMGVHRMILTPTLTLRVTLNPTDVKRCQEFLLNKVCCGPTSNIKRRTPNKKRCIRKSPGKRVVRSTENLLSSPTLRSPSPSVHERSSSTPLLPIKSPLASPLSARSPLSTNNSAGFRRERKFSFGESTLTRIAFQELNLSDAESPVSPSLSTSSLKDENWLSGEVPRRLFSSSPLLSPRRRPSPVTSPIMTARLPKRYDVIHERENLDLGRSANQ